jgi:hypothetical protein
LLRRDAGPRASTFADFGFGDQLRKRRIQVRIYVESRQRPADGAAPAW